MKRILFMILRNFLRFPFIYYKLVKLAESETSTDEERYAHIRLIDELANKGGRVHIDAYGVENIPKENGYLLYPNHQGMYDVLTVIATHEKPFAVVMKKELQQIPLLCRIFQAMRAYAIDREDIRQSMEVMKKVAEDVKNGKNFLIFAEGTRSKNGNNVGSFKGGSFKCAYKAKCPVVPVALVDCFKPFDTNSIKPVTVKVIYLEPISYEEYKDMKTTELALLVETRIQETINAYTV